MQRSPFQNVADSLYALQADADAVAAQLRAQQAAATSLEITRRNLQLGSISEIDVLNAQQLYQQAEINLLQARANRYLDTVALFQSLGGGWWNRSDGVLTTSSVDQWPRTHHGSQATQQ